MAGLDTGAVEKRMTAPTSNHAEADLGVGDHDVHAIAVHHQYSVCQAPCTMALKLENTAVCVHACVHACARVRVCVSACVRACMRVRVCLRVVRGLIDCTVVQMIVPMQRIADLL